jgi:uncharacterized protein YdeI (YjbR/CyaY-like superfamily)
MEREQVEVRSRAEWCAWLQEHHATSPGVWLVTWKKAAGERHVSYEDIVREALCFGWVDSQAKGVDAERTSITMTPRRPGSGWSKPNRDRVAELEAAGLMHPSGAAAVAAAHQDGSWELFLEVEQLIEPPDLKAALDADPAARQGWEALSRSARSVFLLKLLGAKRAETRDRHVARLVAELGDSGAR